MAVLRPRHINCRVTKSEFQALKRHCDRNGVNFSVWAREVLLAEVLCGENPPAPLEVKPVSVAIAEEEELTLAQISSDLCRLFEVSVPKRKGIYF